ncbi:MAG: aminopeptidase P family N-terminal domain-containing protein, partial [Candidatus Hydrogenedentales bacterium]
MSKTIESSLSNTSPRLAAVHSALRAQGIDAIALTPGSSFRYVTGHAFHTSERLTLLIIPSDGTPALVLPNFEEGAWRVQPPFDARSFPWDDTVGPRDALQAA